MWGETMLLHHLWGSAFWRGPGSSSSREMPGNRPIAFSPNSCVRSWWERWVCTNHWRGWHDPVRQRGADALGSAQRVGGRHTKLCIGSASPSSCTHKGGWGRTCLARQYLASPLFPIPSPLLFWSSCWETVLAT